NRSRTSSFSRCRPEPQWSLPILEEFRRKLRTSACRVSPCDTIPNGRLPLSVGRIYLLLTTSRNFALSYQRSSQEMQNVAAFRHCGTAMRANGSLTLLIVEAQLHCGAFRAH